MTDLYGNDTLRESRNMDPQRVTFVFLTGCSINKAVGYCLRTKLSHVNEGGVAAGLGALDSPYLVSDLDRCCKMHANEETGGCCTPQCDTEAQQRQYHYMKAQLISIY